MSDDDHEYGFICGDCGGEVVEIWEQTSVRGGQGAYRCVDCGETGKWQLTIGDADATGLTGCLARREEYANEQV